MTLRQQEGKSKAINLQMQIEKNKTNRRYENANYKYMCMYYSYR